MISREQFEYDCQRITSGGCPVALFGNTDSAEYELLKLPGDNPVEYGRRMAARGLTFIGAIGIVDGEWKSALLTPVDDSAVNSIAKAYCKIVNDAIDTALRETAELYRLYAKPTPEYDA